MIYAAAEWGASVSISDWVRPVLLYDSISGLCFYHVLRIRRRNLHSARCYRAACGEHYYSHVVIAEPRVDLSASEVQWLLLDLCVSGMLYFNASWQRGFSIFKALCKQWLITFCSCELPLLALYQAVALKQNCFTLQCERVKKLAKTCREKPKF